MTTTWLNAWSSDLVPASARAWWLAVQQWLGAAPDLPSLALMDGARRLGWALVLACLVWRGLFGLWRLPGPGRAALAMAVALATLWPGPRGLAHWLGLAFQTPSWTALLLVALWTALGRTRSRRFFDDLGDVRARGTGMRWGLGPLGVVLMGWVLVLDTFAALPAFMRPGFIYPLGYANGALAGAVLVCLGGVAFKASRALGGLGLVACLLFAITRLPSGNLWDALNDPWLWLIAHGILFWQIPKIYIKYT
jgi:hypothetical protein